MKYTERLVSIIIPAYNAEKNIQRCIESVLQQTYKSFELLVIDDGSKDNTSNIINKLAHSDARIKIITQANAGVSAARNRGLDEANGEYIVFLDSDDYVDPVYLEELLEHCNGYSLVCCAYYKESEDQSIPKPYSKENKVIDWNSFGALVLCNEGIGGYVWNKMFRKSIIEDLKLRFNTNIKFCEDTLFCCEYLEQRGDVFFISQPLYHYWQWEGNTINNQNLASLKTQVYSIKQCYIIASNYKGTEFYDASAYNYSNTYYYYLKEISVNDHNDYMKKFNNDLTKYLSRKHKIMYIAYKVLPFVIWIRILEIAKEIN